MITDLRTIEKIEYGHTSARRLALNPDVCRELEKHYIAIDTETTGLDPESDRIVEFGAVLFENGVPADSIQCYVNPGVSISKGALIFQTSPNGSFMNDYEFWNGDRIYVNLNWRQDGYAIAYQKVFTVTWMLTISIGEDYECICENRSSWNASGRSDPGDR